MFMCNIDSIAAVGKLWNVKCLAAGWLLMALLAAGSRALAAEPAKRGCPKRSRNPGAEMGHPGHSLRLSANGYMVDFRYKVLDPEKAATLGDPKAKPYIVDQATGAKLVVPRSPKVGPLRQSAENLTAGKVYFTMFSNTGKAVKAGSKVTVVIGDFKAENLVVE